MSDNNELFAAKDGNQKVELLIKSDDLSGSDGITINVLAIPKFMAAKKKIYALIIALCLVVGACVPMVLYQFSKESPKAQAVITFAYEGASDGKSPDGSALDVSQIKSTYVLQNALTKINLSKEIAVSDLANNITVQGILTDATMQQLEIVKNIDPETTSKYYDIVSGIELVYGNEYIITLENSFGKKEIMLSDGELKALLEVIISEYDNYFFETFSDQKLPVNILSTFSVTDLDYIDALSQFEDAMEELASFCKDKSETTSDFRSSVDGLSFGDIYLLINTKIDTSISPLYSTVYYNHYTSNAQALITKYEYYVRKTNLELGVAINAIKSTKQTIEEYKNEELVITSADESTTKSAQMTSDYYNDLIIKLMNQSENVATLNMDLARYNDIIEWYSNVSGDESNSTVAEKIAVLYDECVELYNLVYSHAEELYSTDYYHNSYFSSINTLSEGSSLGDGLKSAAIGAAIGLILGFVIWVCDGFVCEIKSQSKKHPAED